MNALDEYLVYKTKQFVSDTGFDLTDPMASEKLKRAIHPMYKAWVREAIRAGVPVSKDDMIACSISLH